MMKGAPGEDCELTEVGAVLVGGGELHERFESLVRVADAALFPTIGATGSVTRSRSNIMSSRRTTTHMRAALSA